MFKVTSALHNKILFTKAVIEKFYREVRYGARVWFWCAGLLEIYWIVIFNNNDSFTL